MTTPLPVLSPAPTAPDLSLLLNQETVLVLPTFTAETAWTLGNILRKALVATGKPTAINISLASSPPHTLFAASLPGATLDNQFWIERKRNSALRFGRSTWYLQHKYGGDEVLFAAKNGLGPDAGRYAIHGGGWPVRVRGVEGVVGAIVVSGLTQEQDHAVVLQALREFLESLGEVVPAFEEGEKRKED